MADHDWLSSYTPVQQPNTAGTPKSASSVATGDVSASASISAPDHSWLGNYTPVDSPKDPPKVSGAQAVQSGLEDMLLLGGKDELFAGLDAAAQPLFGTGNDGESFADRYDKNLLDQRAFLKASADQHPVLNTAGGIAGAIIPAVATMGGSLAGTTAATAAKASLAATSAKSAAVGAAQGGAYGFGSADGDLANRAEGAATGAALGGVVGGVAPAVISGLSSAVRRVVPDWLLPANGAQRGLPSPESAPTAPVASGAAATPVASQSIAGAIPQASDTAKAVVDAVNASAKRSAVAEGDLAAAVAPQRNVLDAADRLGVEGLTPGQYSGSQTYRNLEGALSAIPGNELDAQKRASLAQLSAKADDFINDFGGNKDKAAFSDDFKRNANATISGLSTQAEDLYRYIGQQIPKTTQAPANNTISYLQGKLTDLGGKPLLNPQESRALGILMPRSVQVQAGTLFPGQVRTETTYPTYAALDLVRKQIGQGYRNVGPFKDMESSTRDALYSALSRDQEALVNSISPELASVYTGAKSVVAQRKSLEEGLQSVLGKDLSASIATSLGSSVKQLGSGNFKNFDNIIQHIPENDRQSAIVTALNDAFTNKSGAEKSLSASGFTNWYGDLTRNGAARARLTKYLPDDAVKRLDDIYTVADAMSKASGVTRHTGAALGALKDYATQGGMLGRMMDVAKLAVPAEAAGAVLGIPGLGTASVLLAAIKSKPEPIQERAFKLLGSQQFQDTVRAYATSGGELKANVLAREKQMMRTQAYRAWEKGLSDSTRARVATVGPLVYLTEPSATTTGQ